MTAVVSMLVAYGGAPPSPPAFTWNPVNSGSITLSGSNLIATKTGSNSVYRTIMSNVPLPDASYVEILVSGATSPFMVMGVSSVISTYSNYLGFDSTGWGYYQDNGNFFTSGASTAYGASYTTGDIIGIAYRNGKLFFAKNNVWQASGDPVTEANPAAIGLPSTVYVAASLYRAIAPPHVATLRATAAQQTYSPPSGYSAPG